MVQFLKHPFIRKHFAQGIKFAITGGLGAVIDFGTLTTLVEIFGMNPRIAYIPSTFLAAIFVFMMNRHFTFRSHAVSMRKQAAKFALVYGAAVCFNLGLSYLFLWVGVHYLLSKVLAIGVVALWNYSLSHFFVFSKKQEEEVVVF